MVKSRIGILDGFRAIAILSVMLYHYFSRWTSTINGISLYPYDNQYNYFRLGYLGVNFFFIISGFVIFYTLELTPNFGAFWKKRLIRLYPSLIIISLVTFIVISLLDNTNIFPNSHSLWNFQFSLTFIYPPVFTALLQHWHIHFNYLNSSFWSLWPEVQFYMLASILYYSSKQKFIGNFIVISLFLIIAYLTYSMLLNTYPVISHFNIFNNLFSLPKFLSEFALGIIYYLLYQNKNNGTKPPTYLWVLLVLFIILQCIGVSCSVICVNIIMNFLFLGFIYAHEKLHFLESRYLVRIGVVSYVIYLIHENIGVLLIYKFGHYFMPVGFIFPIILILAFCFIANIYTKYVDSKITAFLKHKLLK